MLLMRWLHRRAVEMRPIRRRGPSAARPPPCCARPPGSLRKAAAPLPFTQSTATSSHSRWTDERGPVISMHSPFDQKPAHLQRILVVRPDGEPAYSVTFSAGSNL